MWHYLSYHVSCMYQGSSLMDARHRTLMHTICTKTVTESHIFEQLKKPTYGCILKMPPITFICTPMCLLSPIGKNEFILLMWKIKKNGVLWLRSHKRLVNTFSYFVPSKTWQNILLCYISYFWCLFYAWKMKIKY